MKSLMPVSGFSANLKKNPGSLSIGQGKQSFRLRVCNRSRFPERFPDREAGRPQWIDRGSAGIQTGVATGGGLFSGGARSELGPHRGPVEPALPLAPWNACGAVQGAKRRRSLA